MAVGVPGLPQPDVPERAQFQVVLHYEAMLRVGAEAAAAPGSGAAGPGVASLEPGGTETVVRLGDAGSHFAGIVRRQGEVFGQPGE